MRNLFRLLAPVFALALAGSALAEAPYGKAQLSGAERLRVTSCGRSGGALTLDFEIQPLVCIASILPCPEDGAWSLTGTPAPLSGLSRGGPRAVRLSLDDQSLGALEAALEAEASEICGEAIDLAGLRAGGALKISKSREQARLVLFASARATSADGESSRATYRVRARGKWLEALSL
ncbi:MAG: hypothetical protein FJ091_01935 [Deltaproteobacteria bacterium]|nr:hypothetical protein [Deltaproteobacteria bacterium]